jgi:hypothetical protein
MKTVADLSPDEAATISEEIWWTLTKQRAAQQLLYFALTRDENSPKALKVLCQWLRSYVDADVAMGIIEYAWNTVKDEEQKNRILFYRRMQLEALGLISHPDGTKDLPMETWRTSNDFVIDEVGLKQVLERLKHTPRELFEAVKILYGVRSGLLVAKSKVDVQFEDCFNASDFDESPYYQTFLAATKLKEDEQIIVSET